MAIEYKIYAGSATGGPPDYTAPVATTSALTATLPALAAGSTTVFAVRARGTVTGLTETNTDARVTIVVAADGSDATNRPLAPQGLRVTARAAGAAFAEWSYPHQDAARRPTGFRVYAGVGTPSYTTPAATVPYGSALPGLTAYSAALAGLTGGTTYAVAVRAYNASGEETNAVVITVTAVTSGPGNVLSLAAAPTA